MKILILSQYYPPETGACSNRISGFARYLAAHGHEVTVVTGFPNYPYHKLYAGYRRQWYSSDTDGRVKLMRTWLSIRLPNRPRDRFANYLGFFISSLWACFFKAGPQDVIVATSGPILVGFAGALTALVKRKPFVLDLRDVWPERIVAAGEFKNPVALKVLEWVENFMYARAAQIICVTQGLREKLIRKGVSEKKLTVITNGTDPEMFLPSSGGKNLSEYGIPENAFVVAYTGSMGLLQDHELVLQCAEKLKEYSDIYFLMVGEGVRRESMEAEARRRGLERVMFLANVPREEVARILSRAKIGINTNTNLDHNQMAIPVKMFDYMACQLPVVLANEGEVAAIVRDGHLGICTPPGDAASFAEAILRLYRDHDLREEMGKNGRRVVVSRFSSRILASQFEDLLSHSL